ncbi:hypothetical protein [Aureimonas populi]|uniref:Transposase n=1 Tax=Aureimonas populi TaxID=1701758 RepID=A0ABW5CLT4_9HYPH|nr:hypothetical protein [Aureimonas populi]
MICASGFEGDAAGAPTYLVVEQFRISIATAVRWRSQDRAGLGNPLPMGADRRSGRIKAEAAFLGGLIDGKDDISAYKMQRPSG